MSPFIQRLVKSSQVSPTPLILCRRAVPCGGGCISGHPVLVSGVPEFSAGGETFAAVTADSSLCAVEGQMELLVGLCPAVGVFSGGPCSTSTPPPLRLPACMYVSFTHAQQKWCIEPTGLQKPLELEGRGSARADHTKAHCGGHVRGWSRPAISLPSSTPRQSIPQSFTVPASEKGRACNRKERAPRG